MRATKDLHIVVPHRGVTAGKSRLSGMLDGDARAALNRWLLMRTLDVLDDWLGDVRRCLVVSPCPTTLTLARNAGAEALAETAPGLNGALAQAAAHAAAAGARELLILPSDLPRLDGAALRAMAALSEAGAEMVVAPDRHGSGSNALWLPAALRRFAFGENSLVQHLSLASEYGLRAMLCRDPALAFDLDTPEDLVEWQRSGAAIPTMGGGGRIAA